MIVITPEEYSKIPVKEKEVKPAEMIVEQIIERFNACMKRHKFDPRSSDKMKFIPIIYRVQLHPPSMAEAINRIREAGWNAGFTKTNFGVNAIVIHL